MGKLHTLRRAIEREPDKWRAASGAWHYKKTGTWTPCIYLSSTRSYGSFIKKVLRDLRTR